MYTYPEYLNAMQRIASDLLKRAYEKDPVKFPYSPLRTQITVVADSMTGTASVSWRADWGQLHVTINLPVKPANYRVTEIELTTALPTCCTRWATLSTPTRQSGTMPARPSAR